MNHARPWPPIRAFSRSNAEIAPCHAAVLIATALLAGCACSTDPVTGSRDAGESPADAGDPMRDGGGGFDSGTTPLPPSSISGTVSGDVAEGVTIRLSGVASQTAVTDASGDYAFEDLAAGDYSVVAELEGYVFGPPRHDVRLLGADRGGLDFTALVAGSAGIVFVDRDATGADDGTSWENAFTQLQSALDAARIGNEIWVAEGRYVPTAGYDMNADGRVATREQTFELKDGVAMYGGFAGTESMRDGRDPGSHPTVLSGDHDDNDAFVDGSYMGYGENSFHVLVARMVGRASVLDGFTVSGGNANGPGSERMGAGLYALRSSPSVLGCAFVENTTGNAPTAYGGGLCADEGSAPLVVQTRFARNGAGNGGGMAVHNELRQYEAAAWPRLTDCVFEDNLATFNGGGFYSTNAGGNVNADRDSISGPSILGSTFEGNRSIGGVGGGIAARQRSGAPHTIFVQDSTFTANRAGFGGGIGAENTSVLVTGSLFVGNVAEGEPDSDGGGLIDANGNCDIVSSLFFGNVAARDGGAVASAGFVRTTLVNSVFSGNRAGRNGGAFTVSLAVTVVNSSFAGNHAGQRGGAVYSDSALDQEYRNNVFWGNTADGMAPNIFDPEGEVMCISCIVEGTGGASDPSFVDADGADNTVGTRDDDLRPSAGSPCVDMGSNSVSRDITDVDRDGDFGEPIPFAVDGAPRIQGAMADIGAYEHGG